MAEHVLTFIGCMDATSRRETYFSIGSEQGLRVMARAPVAEQTNVGCVLVATVKNHSARRIVFGAKHVACTNV